jgi:hypothetical protein
MKVPLCGYQFYATEKILACGLARVTTSGKKLEWRGRRRDKKFEPAAAILRLIEKTGYNSYASVLAVLRVEEGKICPAAWLDVEATPHANAVARQAADDADGKFHCGIDAARIIGKDTELVQEAIARTR